MLISTQVPVAATWKARRLAYEREALYSRRLVEAVFARWVRVRRFRRAARDFLRAGGCVEINQCVGCTFLGDGAAVLARSSGEERAPPRHRADIMKMAWRTTERAVKL